MPTRRIAAGSKSVGNGDPLFLGRVDDRLDRQIVVQRLAAAAMNVADGRADLGVGVAVDVFLEEIDEPAVALQDRQHAQVGPGRRLREERLDPRREVGVRQNVPERSQCQPESVQLSSLSMLDCPSSPRSIDTRNRVRPD